MVSRLYWVVASVSLVGCVGWLLSSCHRVMGGDYS